jgi:hypothetical protein
MRNTIIILIIITLFNSCTDASDKDLGSGYTLYIGDSYWTGILNSENTVVIESKIINYAHDSIFILASQRPWSSILGRDTMTYSESNKAFENSTFKQYWIIDKIKECRNIGFDSLNNIARYSNVFGPYSKEEYLIKRKELGVPEELKLKE